MEESNVIEIEFEIPELRGCSQCHTFQLPSVEGEYEVSASFTGKAFGWKDRTLTIYSTTKRFKVSKYGYSDALQGNILLNMYDDYVDGSPGTKFLVNEKWQVIFRTSCCFHYITGILKIIIKPLSKQIFIPPPLIL